MCKEDSGPDYVLRARWPPVERYQGAISLMSGVSKRLLHALEEDGQSAPVGHSDEEAHLSLYARDGAVEIVWNEDARGRKNSV